jgi:hypothetical protein
MPCLHLCCYPKSCQRNLGIKIGQRWGWWRRALTPGIQAVPAEEKGVRKKRVARHCPGDDTWTTEQWHGHVFAASTFETQFCADDTPSTELVVFQASKKSPE